VEVRMGRSRRFSRGGPKRKYAWGGARIGGTQLMSDGDVGAFWLRPPAGALDNTFVPPLLTEPDTTLIRTRSLVSMGSSNGGAQAQSSWNMGFGIIAWDGLTDDPLDSGLLPHPCLDQSLDWVWRAIFPSVLENIALADNATDLDAYQSMAQRKMSNGTGLLFVWGYTALSPGPVPPSLYIYIAADIRYLVKLP